MSQISNVMYPGNGLNAELQVIQALQNQQNQLQVASQDNFQMQNSNPINLPPKQFLQVITQNSQPVMVQQLQTLDLSKLQPENLFASLQKFLQENMRDEKSFYYELFDRSKIRKEMKTNSFNKIYKENISHLYDELPYQCKNCGIRFISQIFLRNHHQHHFGNMATS